MGSANTVEKEVDILAEIPNEGDMVPLVEPESPAGEEEVVEKPSQEGDNTPVEEDEDYKEKTSRRVQQLLKERAEYRERLEALESKVEQNLPQEEEVIPERWSKLFSTGDMQQDKEAYREWKALNQEERAAMKAELLEEIRSQETKEEQEQEQMVSAYEEQMDALEESGKSFDRNELMAYISKRPIFKQDGQPDFETALELMEAKKPKANTGARKKLAAISPQGSISTKGYATPEDLKGGWNSI